jgi:hypothetical protein
VATESLPQIITKAQARLVRRAARLREYRKAHPERFRQYEKNRKSKGRRGNEEKRLATTRLRYQKNKERLHKLSKIWRKNNPDKVAAMKKRHYQKYKEIISQKKKHERLSNPVLASEKRKKYVDAHRNLIRTINKRAALKSPEKTKQYKRNRKARIRGARGTVSTKLVADLMAAQGNVCVCCNSKISENPVSNERKAHLDHIMPICLGGKHSIENLQWLCEPCNLEKGGLHPDEWAKRKSLLL